MLPPPSLTRRGAQSGTGVAGAGTSHYVRGWIEHSAAARTHIARSASWVGPHGLSGPRATGNSGQEVDFLIRIARMLFYMGLFAVSLMTLRVGGALTVGDVLLLCSLLFTLLAIGRPPTPHPFGRSAFSLGLLVFIGGLLATSASPEPMDSLTNLARALYVGLILPWQAAVLLRSSLMVNRSLTAYGLGAAVCALGTVVQYALGPEAIPWWNDHHWRWLYGLHRSRQRHGRNRITRRRNRRRRV